jgi:hypothetical protein
MPEMALPARSKDELQDVGVERQGVKCLSGQSCERGRSENPWMRVTVHEDNELVPTSQDGAGVPEWGTSSLANWAACGNRGSAKQGGRSGRKLITKRMSGSENERCFRLKIRAIEPTEGQVG